MSKSPRRQRREDLGAASDGEADLMLVLADIIEATPPGQRTARMQGLLDHVRTAAPAETA